MSNINKFLNNKIKLGNINYSLIIGLTPSQGARSPKLWNKVYKKIKSDCRMFPADVNFKNLKKLISYLRYDDNFIGGSVTAPYKTQIIKYLNSLDSNAKKIGSVNTIIKKKGKLIGYNTDYYGALSTIKRIELKKNILVFGAGGASKAVILALIKRFKKSNFYFHNRNKSKLKFIKKMSSSNKMKIINKIENIRLLSKLDLIVNTTSIGFDSWIKKKNKFFNLKFFSPFTKIDNFYLVSNKNKSSFNIKNISMIIKDKNNLNSFFKRNKKMAIFDIIYNPKKTKLLKFAERYSIKTYNGLEMNLMQAVKGFMLVNKIKSLNQVKKKMQK